LRRLGNQIIRCLRHKMELSVFWGRIKESFWSYFISFSQIRLKISRMVLGKRVPYNVKDHAECECKRRTSDHSSKYRLVKTDERDIVVPDKDICWDFSTCFRE